MAEIEAVTIESIAGAQVTDDGKTVLLCLKLPGDVEGLLALPVTEALRLVDATCGSIAAASKKIQGGKTVFATQATWFELGRDAAGTAVLTMTFGSGGKMSFALPGQMPEQMFEVLGTMTGLAIPPKPDKPSH